MFSRKSFSPKSFSRKSWYMGLWEWVRRTVRGPLVSVRTTIAAVAATVPAQYAKSVVAETTENAVYVVDKVVAKAAGVLMALRQDSVDDFAFTRPSAGVVYTSSRVAAVEISQRLNTTAARGKVPTAHVLTRKLDDIIAKT